MHKAHMYIQTYVCEIRMYILKLSYLFSILMRERDEDRIKM